jgi:hypothetical protein
MSKKNKNKMNKLIKKRGLLHTLVILSIFSFLEKKKELVATDVVEDFIRNALKRGHSNEKIKQILVNAGWPSKLIKATLKKIGKEPEKKFLGIPTGDIITNEEQIMGKFADLLKQKQDLEENMEDVAKELQEFKELEEDFKSYTNSNKTPTQVNSKQSNEIPEDIKKLLVVIDNLLEKLPEEETIKFTNSPDFELYKKVMGKIVPNSNKTSHQNNKLDEVLKLTKSGIITEIEARKMLNLPVRKEEPKVIVKEIIKKVPVFRATPQENKKFEKDKEEIPIKKKRKISIRNKLMKAIKSATSKKKPIKNNKVKIKKKVVKTKANQKKPKSKQLKIDMDKIKKEIQMELKGV